MGNSKSHPQLAITAVARQLSLQRCQIVVLRDSLKSFADSNGYVEKEFFDEALKRAKITQPSDIEVFDLLFTMWDSKGKDKIHYKCFSIGISPLACPYDDLPSILRFALHIGYQKNNGSITPRQLREFLKCKSQEASCWEQLQICSLLIIIFTPNRH